MRPSHYPRRPKRHLSYCAGLPRIIPSSAVLEEQLHTKLRLRALQCGQNYTLAESASTEDIRREHGGDPCFAEFDEDLAEWLGLHSIGFMLALPPLRPTSGPTEQYISGGPGR